MENSSPSQPLPASPIASGPKAFPWPLTIAAFVGLIFVFFVVLVAGAAIFLAAHSFSLPALQRQANTLGVTLQAVGDAAVILYLLAVVPALSRISLSDLGFRTPNAQVLKYVAGGVVVMFVVVTALGSVFENTLHLKAPEQAVQIFLSLHTPLAKVGFAFLAAVLAPVSEEFVFRLLLFNAMFRWWGFWPAALISSILFGATHLIGQAGGPAAIVAIALPLALGGLVLCWVYAVTRNAWANILTHGLFNFISLALLFVAPQLAK